MATMKEKKDSWESNTLWWWTLATPLHVALQHFNVELLLINMKMIVIFHFVCLSSRLLVVQHNEMIGEKMLCSQCWLKLRPLKRFWWSCAEAQFDDPIHSRWDVHFIQATSPECGEANATLFLSLIASTCTELVAKFYNYFIHPFC